jgi:putative PIN family toxin of toxin-antitoxin system
MKALIDSDVLISYLLNPGSPTPPSSMVRAALRGDFRAVILRQTLDEVVAKVTDKPYLAARIPSELVDSLIELLQEGGEIIASSSERPRRITRDPGDDFMMTEAVLELIDCVVSGDKDLLVLDEIAGVRIVSPAAFVAILDDPAEPA